MKHPIRLGIFMFTPMIGGAERYVRDLIWNLDRQQFEIIFYHQGWSEFEAFLGLHEHPSLKARPLPLAEYAESFGKAKPPERLHQLYARSPARRVVAVAVSALRYLSWKRNFYRLRTVFRRDRLDVLHVVNGGYPGSASAQAAAVAARAAGVGACVMTVAGTPRPPQPPVFLERAIDRRVRQAVDEFVVPSHSVAGELVGLRKFGRDQMVTIPWGIHAPDPPSPGEIDRLRAECEIPSGATVLGMVANFVAYKGHATLIEALELLSPNHPNLWTILVGDGPEFENMRRAATDKGLSARITFTGHLSNVIDSIRTFDICVHPSETEGLPIVVLEAMSQAKPVVATRVGGTPEAVIDGVTGFLVEPADAPGLARATGLLLEDLSMANGMGESGRAAFLERFTLVRMLEDHASLYKRLVNR